LIGATVSSAGWGIAPLSGVIATLVVDDDPRARLGERQRLRLADPTPRTGHHCYSAIEFQVCHVSSFLSSKCYVKLI
jgi:hypothetical protein